MGDLMQGRSGRVLLSDVAGMLFGFGGARFFSFTHRWAIRQGCEQLKRIISDRAPPQPPPHGPATPVQPIALPRQPRATLA
jgi:hypothetical protein